MKALAKKVVSYLIKDDCLIDVINEGELDLEKSNSYSKVIAAIDAVDCFSHIIAYKDNISVCTFLVSLDYDFEPDETVIDYGINEYSERVYEACSNDC